MSGETNVDVAIAAIGDWRGDLLRTIRTLIHNAAPGIDEDTKWVKPSNPNGVPTWSLGGIVCTGEVYRDKVKVTFAQGAKIDDPGGVFNSSLGGKTRRAIDFRDGDELDPERFTELVERAVDLNLAGSG